MVELVTNGDSIIMGKKKKNSRALLVVVVVRSDWDSDWTVIVDGGKTESDKATAAGDGMAKSARNPQIVIGDS